MEIRKAEIWDCLFVFSMYGKMREEVFGLTEMAEEATFLELIRCVYDSDAVLIVAEESSVIIGFMLGKVQPDNTTDTEIGFADAIYVEKVHRAKGVMEALIQGFNDGFKAIGIKEVQFMALPKTDKFWGKLGYEKKSTIYKKEVV